MTRELTRDELELWKAAMSGVTRLDGNRAVISGPKPVARPRPVDNIFNPVIDLHGLTIQSAYHVVLDHIDTAVSMGWRRLTIITGKSGAINVELPKWVEKVRSVSSVKPMNGGGAYEVCLRKDISTQRR